MNNLLDLYKQNTEVRQELKECLKNTQTSEYYKKFGSEAEKKVDVDVLLENLQSSQEDRIEIIDFILEKLSNEKKELIKNHKK